MKDGSAAPRLQARGAWGTSRLRYSTAMNFNRRFTAVDKLIVICRYSCYWVVRLCWWAMMFIVLSKIPVSYYKQRHPTCVGRLMKENKLLLKIEMLLGDIICCSSFLSRIKMLSVMKDDIRTVIAMTISADCYVVPVILWAGLINWSLLLYQSNLLYYIDRTNCHT